MNGIDYEIVLEEAKASAVGVIAFLTSALPDQWFSAYLRMTPRETNVLRFTHGTFEYLYDDYATLEATGVVEPNDFTESRLVVAVGLSRPFSGKRDDSRLRGWVGPTEQVFGREWDKGHFIAHSIGGAVDGLEANVFLQRRSVNRGSYRKLERYCAENEGAFCFSRPIYSDASAKPSAVEFGVLTSSLDFWIETFAN